MVWLSVLEAARQQDRCSVMHNLTTTRNSVFFLGVTGLGSCPSKCCFSLQGNQCQYVMYSALDPSRQTGVNYMWPEDHTAWFQDHASQHSWQSKILMPDRILTYLHMSVQYPSLVTFELSSPSGTLTPSFLFMLQNTFLQVQFFNFMLWQCRVYAPDRLMVWLAQTQLEMFRGRGKTDRCRQ